MPNLALPESSTLSTSWKGPDGKLRPEAITALGVGAAVVGSVVWFWGLIVPFILSMLVDTLHCVYLGGLLAAIMYLVFGKRPRLMFRVLIRKFTSIFVAVYPIEIIEDKLQQMKKRRDKMNEQISLVNGSIVKLQRVMQQNASDAQKGYGMASQAHKMAGATQDQLQQLHMELAMKQAARKAQRREQANIGYQKLLERLQKVYGFLSRYAANVDYFIEDTQDEIDQKKTEFQTTQTAFGAMKQAMAVIKGNATEEDIYDQAFDYIENTVSTQLGVMDDLQRISQNFMDGMDVETGAVDDNALKALNDFEQKTLTPGGTDFKMLTGTMQSGQSKVPIPIRATGTTGASSSADFDDLLK